jgi:hypothetical protein
VNTQGQGSANSGTSGNKHRVRGSVIGGIAVILAALITGSFGLIKLNLAAGISQSIFQLKSSYNGTATSNTNGVPNGFVMFTGVNENSQGHVVLDASFMVADSGKEVDFKCQGQVSIDRRLTLDCYEDDAQNYKVHIQGTILQDGLMEGSWVTTNTFNSNFHHTYSWIVN